MMKSLNNVISKGRPRGGCKDLPGIHHPSELGRPFVVMGYL